MTTKGRTSDVDGPRATSLSGGPYDVPFGGRFLLDHLAAGLSDLTGWIATRTPGGVVVAMLAGVGG